MTNFKRNTPMLIGIVRPKHWLGKRITMTEDSDIFVNSMNGILNKCTNRRLASWNKLFRIKSNTPFKMVVKIANPPNLKRSRLNCF